jgi:hypothetical protein
MLEAGVVKNKDDYRSNVGIVLRIELDGSSVEKSLKTGVPYKAGQSGCLLNIGDEIKAYIVTEKPTKITSEKCVQLCSFGGRAIPNQTFYCLIYKS